MGDSKNNREALRERGDQQEGCERRCGQGRPEGGRGRGTERGAHSESPGPSHASWEGAEGSLASAEGGPKQQWMMAEGGRGRARGRRRRGAVGDGGKPEEEGKMV